MFKPINKGFTVLELLVVVIFFGVVAAIAFPNIFGAQRQERYVNKCIQTGLTKAQCILRFTEIEMGAYRQPLKVDD